MTINFTITCDDCGLSEEIFSNTGSAAFGTFYMTNMSTACHYCKECTSKRGILERE